MALHNGGRRESMKQIQSGMEVRGHQILNDIASAVQAELLERAHLEMPEPSGKSEKSGSISMRVVFQGELSERDQQIARETLQKLANPAELMFLLRKHGEK